MANRNKRKNNNTFLRIKKRVPAGSAVQPTVSLAGAAPGSDASHDTDAPHPSSEKRSMWLGFLQLGTVASSVRPDNNVWSWVVGLFLFFVPIASLYGQTAGGFNPDLHMASYIQVVSVLLLFAYVIQAFFTPSKPMVVIPYAPFLGFFLLFFLWMGISYFWAENHYEAEKKIMDWFGGAMVLLLVLLTIRTNAQVRIVGGCLFASCVAMSLLVIAQYLFSYGGILQHVPPAAVFGNRNPAGEFLILTVAIGFAYMISTTSRLALWSLMFSLVVCFSAILFIKSRGAWLAFLVVVVVFALLWMVKRRLSKAHGSWSREKTLASIIGIVCFLVITNTSPNTFGTGTLGVDKKTNPDAAIQVTEGLFDTVKNKLQGWSSSKTQRLGIWLNSIDLIKDHLIFGTGVGNWMIYYPKYQNQRAFDPDVSHNQYHINAHNDYIEFVAELGLVGTIFMLAMLAGLLYVFFRFILVDQSRRVFFLVAAFVASLCGLGFNAMFAFPLQQPPTIAFVTAFLGCIAVLYHCNEEPSEKRVYHLALNPKVLRASCVVIVLGGLIWVEQLHYRWFYDEIHFRDASAYLRFGDYPKMFRYAKKAEQYNPDRNGIKFFRAVYYQQTEQYDKAIREYEKIRETEPNRLDILRSLAFLYSRLGRVDDVINILHTLVRAVPTKYPILNNYLAYIEQVYSKEKARQAFEALYLEVHAKKQKAEDRDSSEVLANDRLYKSWVKQEEMIGEALLRVEGEPTTILSAFGEEEN